MEANLILAEIIVTMDVPAFVRFLLNVFEIIKQIIPDLAVKDQQYNQLNIPFNLVNVWVD